VSRGPSKRPRLCKNLYSLFSRSPLSLGSFFRNGMLQGEVGYSFSWHKRDRAVQSSIVCTAFVSRYWYLGGLLKTIEASGKHCITKMRMECLVT
jgi:hypothetical protein